MDLTDEALAYHKQGLASSAAQEFWSGRGLTSDTVDRFKLGWIDKPLSHQAESLVGKPTIPYVTLSGKVILVKVRLGKPKLKYLPLCDPDYPLADAPKVHLFNAGHAMPSMRRRDVYVLEGEIDVMTAVQCGVRAVGVPSASFWFDPWSWLFSSASVHIVLDGDEAGRAGAKALSAVLAKARVRHDQIELPEGIDVNAAYLTGGRARVRELLRAG